jgi:endoglucanase
MEAIWDGSFGFVVKDNTAPLLVGEFGIKDMKSYDGKAGTWFTTFLKYMADNSYSWTFWCFNPNSGDTGGLLSYDWQTVEQWKLDALKPWCAPLVNEPASVRPTVGRKSPNNKMLTILNNQITCNIKTSGTFNLEIINLSGQIVVSTTKFPLSLKTISSGTYTAVLRKNYKVVEFLRFAIN